MMIPPVLFLSEGLRSCQRETNFRRGILEQTGQLMNIFDDEVPASLVEFGAPEF